MKQIKSLTCLQYLTKQASLRLFSKPSLNSHQIKSFTIIPFTFPQHTYSANQDVEVVVQEEEGN